VLLSKSMIMHSRGVFIFCMVMQKIKRHKGDAKQNQ